MQRQKLLTMAYKFLVSLDKKGSVLTVESFERYAPSSESEIMNQLAKFNEENESRKYQCIEIGDVVLAEAIKFLLGENKYKTTQSIDSVCYALSKLNERLELVSDSINECSYSVEGLKSLAENIKEQVNNIGQQ